MHKSHSTQQPKSQVVYLIDPVNPQSLLLFHFIINLFLSRFNSITICIDSFFNASVNIWIELLFNFVELTCDQAFNCSVNILRINLLSIKLLHLYIQAVKLILNEFWILTNVFILEIVELNKTSKFTLIPFRLLTLPPFRVMEIILL